MRYVLNVKSLLPGDIILVGYNDKNSRTIQQRTNSKYSHAMLYWFGSIIHASDIVITKNPSRELFEEDENVCVLRLKDEEWNSFAIQALINYARSFVGTYYDYDALFAMKRGEEVIPNENRQMCSKFIAQCYEHVGLDLVDDYNLCSPEDIRNSTILREIPNCLREATQDDIDFAEKIKDVTKEQHKAIKSFLESLNMQYRKEDIVSLKQLERFIEDNPNEGDCVLGLLEKTDYFDLWKIEKKYCSFLYDVDAFKEMWKKNAGSQARAVINDCERIIEEKQGDIQVYKAKQLTIGDLEYYRQMIVLRENIIGAAKERIEVATRVLADLGIVKIKFPWCL